MISRSGRLARLSPEFHISGDIICAVITICRATFVVRRQRQARSPVSSVIDWCRKNRMDGLNRMNIKAGDRVLIVQKQDQRTGETTEGIVQDILTKSRSHPHGIKVRLVTGEVGRVKKTASEESQDVRER